MERGHPSIVRQPVENFFSDLCARLTRMLQPSFRAFIPAACLFACTLSLHTQQLDWTLAFYWNAVTAIVGARF
jgi:hypothetical protein